MSQTVEMNDAIAKREYAKLCLLNSDRDPEKIREGMRLLNEACREKDPEATFVCGKLMLDGVIRPKEGEHRQEAMKLLFAAEQLGWLQAKVLLAELCEKKYADSFASSDEELPEPHPLTDFDGCEFEIQRKGLFTPVDAVLEYVDGKNILTFRLNLRIKNDFMMNDAERFTQAVIAGIREWEGEYRVFGNQQLTVKIDVTAKKQLLDNVSVILVNDMAMQSLNEFSAMTSKLGGGRFTQAVSSYTKQKHSFTSVGDEWSVTSKKMMCITCEEDGDSSYEEISMIAKHEFGHVLGLGDLYRDYKFGLKGVEQGSYKELDSYYISDEIYNLIMCDVHGAVSNNDIEMVVLAFSDNCLQRYQPDMENDAVSEALGKGN